MMTLLLLLGGLFLAWAFGRNNFSNVFGSAVGTGIVPFKWAVFLTAFFLLLGVSLNGSGTAESFSSFAHFTSLNQAFLFSLLVAFIMLLLTHWGIPASVTQISVGALVGWNLALQLSVPWDKVISIIWGWLYSPVIAFGLAFLLFKGIRFCFKKWPVPILYRDICVRCLWLLVGSFSAYSLGANNLPVLTVPFTQTLGSEKTFSLLFSLWAGLGCLMASKRVIKMMTTKLFPLSSTEGLIVGFSGAFTLLLFSFEQGVLPALPISIGAALIGAIVGVSFAKGGYGLKLNTLFSVVTSWFWAPLFSGLLCYGFQTIIMTGGF